MNGLRSAWLVFLTLGSGHAIAADQVWEKPVAPGLTYRMEIRQDPPRLIHVLKWITSSPVVTASPELANRTVFSASGDGKAKVSQIVEQTGAIAAINADFFGASGDPLGLMVKQNQLVSLPNPKRSIFAWGAQNSGFGFAKFSGTVQPEPSGKSIEFTGFNELCGENRIVLNSPDAGMIKVRPGATFVVLLKIDGGRLSPTTQIGATVTSTTSDGSNMRLAPNQFALVAHGNKIPQLTSLKPNQRVKLNLSTSGFEWERFEHAVSGGPFLLRDGQKYVDAENQGFSDDWSNVRNPRTALGRTSENDLIFVAIDGRQKMSVGATLDEAAEILRSLGCRDAINLDGGGSTCLNLLGVNVNRPSDVNGERPVANAVAFYGPRFQPSSEKYRIQIAPTLSYGKSSVARVVDSKDREIPNIEVIWSMQGSAWIDQGGQITVLEPGQAELSAYVRGVVIKQKFAIK